MASRITRTVPRIKRNEAFSLTLQGKGFRQNDPVKLRFSDESDDRKGTVTKGSREVPVKREDEPQDQEPQDQEPQNQTVTRTSVFIFDVKIDPPKEPGGEKPGFDGDLVLVTVTVGEQGEPSDEIPVLVVD